MTVFDPHAVGRRGSAPLVAAAGAVALGVAGTLVTATGSLHGDALLWPIPFVGMTLVGALIARRLPAHRVAWVLVGIGLAMLVNHVATEYAVAVYDHGRNWAGGAVAAWLGVWLWVPATMALGILFVLFPSGTAPTRPWVWFVRFVWLLIAASAVASLPLLPAAGPHLFTDGMLGDLPGGGPLEALSMVGVFVALGGGIVGAVARYRRSHGVERQQMKWLAASSLSFAATIAMGLSLPGAPMDNLVYRLALTVCFLLVPAAMAAAILRHRLYDIDVLIRRTVTYAVVSGLLLAIYLVGVLLLGHLVQSLTDDASSDLAIAGSTLLAAAAFHPIRRRVQLTLDRRFDRAGTDAAQAVERLAHRLRDEVDVHALTDDITGIVRTTVRPSAVSVWLRAADH